MSRGLGDRLMKEGEHRLTEVVRKHGGPMRRLGQRCLSGHRGPCPDPAIAWTGYRPRDTDGPPHRTFLG